MCGLGTRFAVFKHKAARRRDTQKAGGQQIGFRVGLGAGDIIHRNNRRESCPQAYNPNLVMRIFAT
jgi:hypothetical protein